MSIKILHQADIHILLHKKKVPYEWQKNRFRMYFEKMLELERDCQLNIIAGDIFDKAPETDEVALFLSYINRVRIPTHIIPGNHEATRKGKSFLEHFKENYALSSNLVHIHTENKIVPIQHAVQHDTFSTAEHLVNLQFFPYGEMQVGNLPKYVDNSILVTHIRGEVLPHITPEFDFEKLRQWKLILCGDLHFNHKYKDFPCYYPGSPMNVSFDRDEKREYGVNIIHFNSINDYKVEFRPLGLPKLLRKVIKAGENMIPSDYDHIIYEVEGSVTELAKITNSDLLDKKIAHKPSENAKLNLAGMTLEQELIAYLQYTKQDDIQGIMSEFKELKV